ncbi:MAG TPA: hypothetical protein VK787_02980 [Puia sp.]|jgi:hypothetical protein|nr:hypothetical protein [Puia sp.]
MSLDNIHLSEKITSTLYKDVLVDAKKNENVFPRYKFLGNNQKQITIVVQSHNAVFIEEKHLSFITKMLEACKMNIGDIALVSHTNTPVIIQQLKQQLQPQTLILFGIESVDIKLPFNFPQFKTQDYDGCTYLCVPSLNELDSDVPESKLLKSKLWVCLRKLFEI